MASLADDKTFRRTKEYTTITDLLRLLHNALIKIIESWENFEKGEIQYFEVEDYQALRKVWDSHLAAINKDMSELQYLRRSLLQRIEMFDNKRSGVSVLTTVLLTSASRCLTVQLVNASAMVETRVATLQGNDIGRLTRVTVVGQESLTCALLQQLILDQVYLPLSLGTVSNSMPRARHPLRLTVPRQYSVWQSCLRKLRGLFTQCSSRCSPGLP